MASAPLTRTIQRRIRGIRVCYAIPTAFSLVLLLLAAPVYRELRAIAVLLHIENPHVSSAFANIGARSFDEADAPLALPTDRVRGRLYTPRDEANPPALVLVHGVHHLGIDEPRLVNFARTLASQGIVVYTPELPAIADYTVNSTSEPVIAAAINELSHRTGASRVGLVGLSFAGGLALIAATDPACADRVAYVAAIGAHHDLERVLTFFATDSVQGPEGVQRSLAAHEYGPLVAVYSHVQEFFSKTDAVLAHEAIGLLLRERINESHAVAKKLSADGQRRMANLYDKHRDDMSRELLRHIPDHRAEMISASPRGHLAKIQVPVLLLHGDGDNVIPATETEWLAREVPPQYLRAVLVSPAINHVEMNGPALRDKFALVEWMAALLAEADESPKGN